MTRRAPVPPSARSARAGAPRPLKPWFSSLSPPTYGPRVPVVRSAGVAFLGFLAAGAGTRVVAPDLLTAHYRLCAGAVIPTELQLSQLLVFLALDIAREVLHVGLRGQARL